MSWSSARKHFTSPLKICISEPPSTSCFKSLNVNCTLETRHPSSFAQPKSTYIQSRFVLSLQRATVSPQASVPCEFSHAIVAQTGQGESGRDRTGCRPAAPDRDGMPSAIDLGPWHLYENCCRERVCRPFLCRAGQIWVVPRLRSWDVQWIQSVRINGALFSYFFLATEPADNSGGRAGGPWR